MKNLGRENVGIKAKLVQARSELNRLQLDLINDRENAKTMEQIKICTKELIILNEVEEMLLKQKSKITWLRLGDGNNAYFYASLKARHKHKSILIISRC